MLSRTALYYSLLTAITLGCVITTVFTASTSVDYGYQVKNMKVQQANLRGYQTTLQHQLSAEKSLELAQNFAASHNFIPAHQIVNLVSLEQLASR